MRAQSIEPQRMLRTLIKTLVCNQSYFTAFYLYTHNNVVFFSNSSILKINYRLVMNLYYKRSFSGLIIPYQLNLNAKYKFSSSFLFLCIAFLNWKKETNKYTSQLRRIASFTLIQSTRREYTINLMYTFGFDAIRLHIFQGHNIAGLFTLTWSASPDSALPHQQSNTSFILRFA